MFSKLAYSVFQQSIRDYHQFDNVDQLINNPYSKDQFEHLLYHKNWIDTVQWHFEDIIRDPNIDPVSALALKRRIDASNEEATRADASAEHRSKCNEKLNVLLEQRSDLSTAIDDLLHDIERGDKFMKVYKQMKMYNDDDLNPILYQNKK